MEVAIQEVQNYLTEREVYWRSQVARLQEKYEQANRNLRSCTEKTGYAPRYSQSPTTSYDEIQKIVVDTQRKLTEAQNKVDEIKRWRRQVEQYAEEYRRQAQQTLTFLDGEIPKATSLLKQWIQQLESYIQISSSPMGSSATHTVQTTTADTDFPLSTDKIEDIPLAQIDWENIEPLTPKDYKKVPYNEMRAGLLKLQQVVKPQIELGATEDDFMLMDDEQGLEYAHGYHRIYEAFYGRDAIAVEKVGEKYRVLNGRHRLLLAKELGWESIPARIVFVSRSNTGD